MNQFTSTGGTGETVNCNAVWLAAVQALGAADAKFDFLTGNRHAAFTFDFARDPGDTVVAASLTVSLRDVGTATTLQTKDITASSVTNSTADPRVFLNDTFQPPDVTSDGISSDVSGNGRNATITNIGNGSASYTADFPAALAPRHTQSLSLTEHGTAGASRLQRIISPTTELDFKTADWTVAGWVKRSEAVDQDIIFHLGTGNGKGGANGLVLGFGNGSANAPLSLRNWNASAMDVDLNMPVSAADWHHLAAVLFPDF